MRYQNMENELLENLGRLHTTELGVIRIKKNLSLNVENVIEFRLVHSFGESLTVV